MICPSCFGTNSACRVCGGGTLALEARRPHLDLPAVRRDLEAYGTPAHPLRSSGLGLVVTCPWRAAMTYVFAPEDRSGPAADTGSATHAAVAAWHGNGHDRAASVAAMVASVSDYPQASLDEATAMFLMYARDPRNADAEVVGIEQHVLFQLPPHPDDHTGEPIVVKGKVDQIRRVNGRLEVWDLKTSKLSGLDLMREHMAQVAAYCVGASHLHGEPVHPGSLVCPRHYRAGGPPPEDRPPGVFFPYPWSFEDARFVLWGLRRVVAAVRAGEVWMRAGDHCRWCPAGSPDVCLPRLRAATDPATMRIHLPEAPPAAPSDVGPVDVGPFDF